MTTVLAIALTAIIGLVALGTDVGRLYLARQRVAAAADAAALSGAQLMPYDRTAAVRTVSEYLAKNGVASGEAIISLDEAERTLTVLVEQTVPFTFARVLGRTQARVSAGAVARVQPVSGFWGVVPFGVVRADWKLGDRVDLKAGGGGQLAPGNYGPLALGARGSASYENNLRNGYTDWIRAGDWLAVETGNMAGPTERAMLDRIARDPNASYNNVHKLSPRIIIIPVLDSFVVNGRGEVQVVGFAAFFLEGAGGRGTSQGTVYGRFLRYIVTGESNGTGADLGAYTVKLTR